MSKTKRIPKRDAAHMKKGRRSRHLGRIAFLCALSLILTGVSTVGFTFLRLIGNVDQRDASKDLGTDRPTFADGNAGRALNILLLGSDVRTGKSDVDGAGARGEVEGMRADTTMIMHISADRKRVYFVSIPRDTIVDIPSCVVRDSDENKKRDSTPVRNAKFNTAFAIGGAEGYVHSAATCSMKTVENLTNVKLNGYIVVNFGGFKSIVDNLGGIPMYFPEALQDDASGLDVPQGCRLLDGQQALALARARKNIGDGSDIGRISRQQDLIKAIVKEAQSLNLFTDYDALMSTLDVVTKNIQTSKGYGGIGGITRVVGLVNSLGSLDNPTFITVPWEYAGARVKVRADATRLWDALAKDKPLTFTVDAEGKVVDQAPSPAQQEQQPVQGKVEDSSAATGDRRGTAVKASGRLTPVAQGETTPACTKKNARG